MNAPLHKAQKAPKPERISANPPQPAPGLTTRLGQHARRDAATEKQVAFIRNLIEERDLTPSQKQAAEAMLAGGITKSQATAWIGRLKTMPRQQKRGSDASPSRTNNAAEGEAARGMYKAPNGTIIRVYLGQQSGFNLCKQLVDTGQPHPEDPSIHLHEWKYMGRATTQLRAGSVRMTLEEAKEYGRMTGTCCRCGRRLDVPESVERGIGPVCGRKKHWVSA